jgi:DNA replication protein DnaC
MTTEQTIEILKEMKCLGMAEALEEQQRTVKANELSFDERVGLMVDAEYTYRKNKRFGRYLKDAKLRYSQACIEDIDYPPKRNLDKSVILQLASCRWVRENQSVIITGKTGVGKSYLACALANQACRKGYRAVYRRAPRLFEETTLAHASGTFIKLLSRFAKIDVMIIDDFGISPLSDADRRDLLEILEDRDGLKSTIVTSQLSPDVWHDYIAEPTLADAICDRLLHSSHRIVLKGHSKRPETAKKGRSKN